MKVWIITEINNQDDDGNMSEMILGVAGTEAERDFMLRQDSTWDGHRWPTDSWRHREADEYEVRS